MDVALAASVDLNSVHPAYWIHLIKLGACMHSLQFSYQQINIPKQIQQQLLPVAAGEELVWQKSLWMLRSWKLCNRVLFWYKYIFGFSPHYVLAGYNFLETYTHTHTVWCRASALDLFIILNTLYYPIDHKSQVHNWNESATACNYLVRVAIPKHNRICWVMNIPDGAFTLQWNIDAMHSTCSKIESTRGVSNGSVSYVY